MLLLPKPSQGQTRDGRLERGGVYFSMLAFFLPPVKQGGGGCRVCDHQGLRAEGFASPPFSQGYHQRPHA